MTTAVKIFAHKGVVSVKNVRPAQAGAEGVVVLLQPYLAREAITATGTAASSSAATAPENTTVLSVEVADGGSIRYEINQPGRNVTADVNSPRLSGTNLLDFGQNWQISVIEA